MNGQTVDLSRKTEDLLDVLRRDIEHLERTLVCLNELRCFVIKRDEKGLARLLDDIRVESRGYQANEQRRNLIREELSVLLGCKTGELTLSVLTRRLGGAAKAAIAESQQRLKMLVGRLQKEYVSTVSLLSDCARINSALLKIMFNRGRSGLVCYDSAGLTERESGAAFMNMRL
jgi:hypothetical protein